MGDPHRIGIVGLGNISRVYLETLAASDRVAIAAVADLDPERSRAVADETGALALTVEELLTSDEVDTVVNLTVPAAHAEVAIGALERGKQVYGEKPLAATFADAVAMMDAARRTGRRLGSAPDTVLGTGTQTARAAIDGGVIGRPFAATAVMITPGHERWHPSPDFYYLQGGGPLLDMGPYYLAALIHLLGPVRSVIGSASHLRTERTISTGPRAGEVIPVEVDTHVSGVLEHVNGALSTITTSFDGVATMSPEIEVHGELGSLIVPDPNQFAGEVQLHLLGDGGWRTLDPSAGYVDAQRGVGLLDFLDAGPTRPARAGGELALHSMEIMTGLLRSAKEGTRVDLTTTATRPDPVPLTPLSEWRSRAGSLGRR